ncbi:MAG TPA: hypothetical protein VK151_11305 [Fluviicola sp.]|nr:hypothetical protein [Fluviicola sp.]
MRILLLFSFFILASNGFSQTGKLTVSVSNSNYYVSSEEDTTYFTLYISNQTTSIRKTILVEWENGEITIDSLVPNEYLLRINNTEPDSMQVYQCRFSILPLMETTLNIVLGSNEYHYDIEEETQETIVRERVESQFELGYFNNKWTETNPDLTSSLAINSSFSYWSSFSKHFGVLFGGGIGIGHSSFSKDTVYFNAPQFDKRYEYFNYVYLNPEIKLRFTLKNQQHNDFMQKGLIIDIGARYNLPIVFKHIGRFAGNTKIVESSLHQFTDCRAFVSVGRAPVMVFAEYRLSDFILGNYPELPKFNTGIRFLLHYVQ